MDEGVRDEQEEWNTYGLHLTPYGSPAIYGKPNFINMKKKETLVVLSSPSGGGKTTICQRILKKHKDYIYSVSATTREKRKGEKRGKHYLFLGEKEFTRRIKKGEFVEWAWVHGKRYGTLKKFVMKTRKEGKVALFVLDVQGGMALKKKYPQSVLIFILPPSFDELKRRLTDRGTEKTKEMQQRLKTALKEIKFWSKYDYVVINKNLNQATQGVEKIIEAERLKSFRFDYDRWGKKK